MVQGNMQNEAAVPTQHVGFFLLPGFAMMGFSAAVEPLRSANRLSGKNLFKWSLLSEDGDPVCASNGIEITTHYSITQPSAEFDLVIICAGFFDHELGNSRVLLDWLRKLASRGCTMGAISTGSEILANAGLLDGTRCTIHWENDESFRENHPSALLTGGIYEIDRNRITAAGGIASLDLMLNWISRTSDEFLASAIAEQFIYDHLRTPGEFQRNVEIRQARRRSPKLANAIEMMMANIEDIKTSSEIAAHVGLSLRQLERLFLKYRQKTLHRYYLNIRLERARHLIFYSGVSLLEVSVATGFSSQSHFSRCYKERFNSSPSKDRNLGETVVY
jgi:transcriptional regulator GlxA family with amidase domain